MEVRSGQQTRTMAYGPGGHLRSVQWSDGQAVNVRFDTALRLRGLTEHAQREIHRWDSILHLNAKGRVTHLSEPMGRMDLRWDDAGRLQSAATDEGVKVVVRWNETTNSPRALITSWGYVDFDTQGHPQDLYTLDGFRSPAVWREGGRLERVMSPLVGILRVQDGPDGRPTAIQFPDGQRTELTWEQDRGTHGRATEPSGRHHPQSQITIYVTDMGIHNWDKQLRMFEDFQHAKAGPIVPEVTPQGQLQAIDGRRRVAVPALGSVFSPIGPRPFHAGSRLAGAGDATAWLVTGQTGCSVSLGIGGQAYPAGHECRCSDASRSLPR